MLVIVVAAVTPAVDTNLSKSYHQRRHKLTKFFCNFFLSIIIVSTEKGNLVLASPLGYSHRRLTAFSRTLDGCCRWGCVRVTQSTVPGTGRIPLVITYHSVLFDQSMYESSGRGDLPWEGPGSR